MGVIMLGNETLPQAREHLTGSDWFLRSHRLIFEKYCELADTGKKINPISVQDLLRRDGELEEVGGAVYIAGLFDGAPRFSHIETYVRIVRDKATKRRVIQICSQTMNAGLDDGEDASELLARTRRLIEDVKDPADNSRWATVKDAAVNWSRTYSERIKSGRKYDGLATGLTDLDGHLSGVSKGDITLIGARPGVGKTSLLTAIAERATESPHNGGKLIIGVFSTELNRDQFILRWAASHSGVRLKAIRENGMNKDESEQLKASMRYVASLPVFIDDQSLLTPSGLRAAAQRLQREHPKSELLLILDYIQMMQADRRYGDKRTEVTEISHDLKRIVKDDLGCYLIAAASLKRLPEHRKSKEPELEDLRESGDLESDAAAVILLHRAETFEAGYMPHSNEKVLAKICKGRFCGPGRVDLAFDAPNVRFGDYIEQPREWRQNYTD